MIKNSEDFTNKTANDPLGAQALACFFSKSGKPTLKEGIKFEAKIVDDSDDDDTEDDSASDSEEVKKSFSILQFNA